MTERPLLLDAFSGGGGLSVGYHRAGFDVVGVDHLPHPDYPFPMIVGDAMETLDRLAAGETVTFSHAGADRAVSHGDVAVWAGSPPCPRWATSTPGEYREDHPDLLTPFHAWVTAHASVWVIENVMKAPVPNAVMFCGRAMGLRWTRRHRKFGSNVPLLSPGCACGSESPYGVTGDGPEIRDYARNGRKARSVAHAQDVMGIPWMSSWDDLADAVPPAYSEFIGSQLLEHLERERAA